MNCQSSFLTKKEIYNIGFLKVGDNVKISRFARFYNHQNIEIGNNVRIDDFCILSGNIKIGSNIHISAYSALYGNFGIELEDNTGISPRCIIFSAIDDFSGNSLVGAQYPEYVKNLSTGKVLIKKYSQIGANTIVFPKIIINEGVAVGAFSLVNKDLDDWGIYAGIPARFIKKRDKKMLDLLNKL